MQLLSKRDIVFLLMIFFAVSCSENEHTLITDFESHKTTLDKKIEEVVKQQEYYKDSIKILTQNQQYLDTFDLARKLIPLTGVKLLLETDYDKANETIDKINNKKINEAEAKITLDSLNENYKDLLSKYKLN